VSAPIWLGILLTAAGCFALKVAGLSVPERVLDRPLVRRVSALLPVALLSALVVVQAFATGHRLVVDARAGGLAAGALAVLARAPFLLVVAVAAGTAAALRLLTG